MGTTRLLSIAALVLASGCSTAGPNKPVAAPTPPTPPTSAAATAFTLGDGGRWSPALVASATFTPEPGSTAELVAFDANERGAAIVVRQSGTTHMDGTTEIRGTGLLVMLFGPDGAQRRASMWVDGNPQVTSIRVLADGVIVLGASADETLRNGANQPLKGLTPGR
jgi:hypothetical protein